MMQMRDKPAMSSTYPNHAASTMRAGQSIRRGRQRMTSGLLALGEQLADLLQLAGARLRVRRGALRQGGDEDQQDKNPRHAAGILARLALIGLFVLLGTSAGQWFGQSALNGPALSEAGVQRSTMDTNALSPRAHGKRLASERQESIDATVAQLRRVVGPSTVAWSVRTGSVDSIKRVSRWTRPHVAQELREVLAPIIGHRDAASAVVLEVVVPGVVATRLRGEPRAVLAPASLRESVLDSAETDAHPLNFTPPEAL